MKLEDYIAGEQAALEDSLKRFGPEISLASNLADFYLRLIKLTNVPHDSRTIIASLFLVVADQLYGVVSQILRRRVVDALALTRRAIEAAGAAKVISKHPESGVAFASAYPSSGKLPECDSNTGRLKIDPGQWRPSKEYAKQFRAANLFGHEGEEWEYLRAIYAQLSAMASHTGPLSAGQQKHEHDRILARVFADDTASALGWYCLLETYWQIWNVFWGLLSSTGDKRRSPHGRDKPNHPKPRRRVVDLPRAQRALADLSQVPTQHPEVRERTARMLAGELPCPDLEEKPPCPRNRKRRGSPKSR